VRAAKPQKTARKTGGLSKLNSVHVEVDVASRRVGCPDGSRAIEGSDACRSKSSGIP
jgi:hypothetical protein